MKYIWFLCVNDKKCISFYQAIRHLMRKDGLENLALTGKIEGKKMQRKKMVTLDGKLK